MSKRYRRCFKYVLEEQSVQGICNAVIYKDSMGLIFPKDIADLMQIEQNNNLNYKIQGENLIISKLPDNREDTYNL